MEFLSAIIDIVEFIKDPIRNYVVAPIKQHVSYAFNWKANVKNLRDDAQLLKDKKEPLRNSVDAAPRQDADKIQSWLEKANAALDEAQPLIDGEDSNEKKRCFMGLLPNLKLRYQVSKKACRKRVAINELLNEKDLDPDFHRKQIVPPSVYTAENFPSRVSLLKKVMDALKDPNHNMIGVFGMGGVGKTTLAQEVHRQVQADKLFDHAIFVPVSLTPKIESIQSSIAQVLGVSLTATDISIKANELFEGLKKEKKDKKFLIILDDMWNRLELHTVGIPFGNDHKGCKILVTSRRMEVCRDMGAQAPTTFPIDFLSEAESWSLFMKNLPQVENNDFRPLATDINKKCGGLPLLIDIVAKDLRKGKGRHAWEDKLKQLSHFDDLDKRVSLVLRSSYDNLKNEETKAFFLLCGLFGQSNIRVEYLVRYCAGLNLFKRLNTIKDTRNRILTSIDDLKEKSLLLDGDMIGFVKIHDLVRDTACLISSEEQHAFIGMAGAELEGWPSRECTRISLPYCKINGTLQSLDCPNAELLLLSTEDSSLEIPNSFFEGIQKLKVFDFSGLRFVCLPSSLRFLTNLHSLCLHQCELGDIAIIGELKQLWVLSLVGSKIVQLPKEMEQLTQLKSLDLSDCSGIIFIPTNMFSNLHSLEELYLKKCCMLQGAEGEKILTELSGLSRLTSLEIHVADDMAIPEALANQLERYKILIGNNWFWDQICEDSSTVLKIGTSIHLKQGVKLLLKKAEEVHLAKMKGIKNFLDILDGDGFLELKHLRLMSSNELLHFINSTTKLVFQKLESLYIEDLDQLEKICDSGLADGSFQELKILEVQNCPKLKHLFSSSIGTIVFFKLESLKLEHLDNLEEICYGGLTYGIFKDLRTFEVQKCPRLKYLFSISIARSLLQLEYLHVNGCDEIKEVIIRESEEENGVVEFPQLLSLKLGNLPQLRRFCNNKGESVSDTASLFNKMIVFSKLESLVLDHLDNLEEICIGRLTDGIFKDLRMFGVQRCRRLKYLFSISLARSLLQLENLHVSDCDEIKEVIIRESKEENGAVEFPQLRSLILHKLPQLRRFCNDKGESESDTASLFNKMVAFPNLEFLRLENLEKLNNIWDGEIALNSFYKLQTLFIESCGRLTRIFSSHVIQNLQKLQKLSVYNCNSVEEIYEIKEGNREMVVFSNLESLELRNLEKLDNIWNSEMAIDSFCKLETLHIGNCGRLTRIFPSYNIQRFQKLQKLNVFFCDLVEEIFEIEEGNNVSTGTPTPFELRDLDIRYMKSLKQIWSKDPKGAFTFQNLISVYVVSCDCLKYVFQASTAAKDLSNLEKLEINSVCQLVDKLNVPKLEHIAIRGDNDLKYFLRVEFPIHRFPKLKSIKLIGLRDASQHLVSGFLERLSLSIQTLAVESSDLIEVLFSNEGLINNTFVLPLEHLTLRLLRKLKHIWKEDSQLKSLCKHLRSLDIKQCDSLTNIAPSSSSFENLAILSLYSCEGLRNLITTSTAKTMVQLKEIKVSFCNNLTEIVASDTEEKDTIIFTKLTSLRLHLLSKLARFCSANHSFNFPCLEQVYISGCSQMETFCHGDVSTPKLRAITHAHAHEFAQRSHWEGSINATIAYMNRSHH